MELKVMETMDYNLFSKFNGNRDVNMLHVNRIAKSMTEQYLIKPIDVNEKHEVIDGQHRLEACKETGNPVYYIVHKGWGLKEAHRLNANQKNWTTEEYLKGYCDLGFKDYIEFHNFKSEFSDMNFTVLLSVAMGRNEKPTGEDLSNFKNGDFKFKDKKGAERKLTQLMMVKPYYSGYNNTVFAWAVFSAIKNEDFSFQEFISKLAYQSTKLVDCTNTKQYLISIEDIYNFKRRGENVRLF
jgi:hypothetical protein